MRHNDKIEFGQVDSSCFGIVREDVRIVSGVEQNTFSTVFHDSQVLVADTMDGAPIGPKLGPFRLVAPHERRPARWVRMLKSITVGSPQG
jgi:hypothetical protein